MPTPNAPHPFISATIASVLVVFAFVTGVGAVSVLKGMQHSQTAAADFFLPLQIHVDSHQLVAKAAIVYDPTTGHILFEKNAYESLPLASLTKLVTAMAILDRITGNPIITIGADHLVQNGAVADASFSPGNRISLDNLLNIGLIASSNDAMQAAATTLGDHYTQVLQATAFNLGLTSMRFNNATGLDVSTTTAGAYGSAYDIAVIAAKFAARYPHYFNLTQMPGVTISSGKGSTISAEATTVPLQDIPGFVGAKTGYTTLAGGNVVAIFDVELGHPLVIAVLGSTQTARFTDVKTLIEAARNAL